MKLIKEEALSFNDVTLSPQYSDVISRSNVDLTMKLYTRDPNITYSFPLPIISSPMSTVTESEMAFRMALNGGLGIIHRFNSIDEQVDLFLSAQKKWNESECSVYGSEIIHLDESIESVFIGGAAIGANGDYIERCQALLDCGVKVICVDIAHGDHIIMKMAMGKLLKIIPDDIHIMLSSVATGKGAFTLRVVGGDSCRIGIGSGGNCSTNLETGHGMPTLQSLFDVREKMSILDFPKYGFIADGGCRHIGDIVKCFGAGANMVMLGSFLAGSKASPGSVIKTPDGRWHKEHRGSASEANQRARGITNPKIEGISALVPYSGKLEVTLQSIRDGLSSGCSYSGVHKLEDLHEKAIFQRITNSSYIQGTPHILNR